MIGGGSYDKEHDAVHEQTGARGSILIVLDGKNGDGFSCRLTPSDLKMLPKILRLVANDIGPELQEDLKQIEATKKKGEQPDSGPQSFAG